MKWFFVRGNEHLKLEVRKHEAGYEQSLERSNGIRIAETFNTPGELLARWHGLPHALKLDGWRLPPIWSDAPAEGRS